jgi:hypothetical protein
MIITTSGITLEQALTSADLYESADPSVQNNPWLRDPILFNVAVWWVRATQGDTDHFASDVSREFGSLVRDLRHEDF